MAKKLRKKKAIDIREIFDASDPSPTIIKLEGDKKRLTSKVRELKEEIGSGEAHMSEVLEGIESIAPLRVRSKAVSKKKSDTEVSAVVVLSDWHIGELVDPDEIDNENAFSWDIAQRRVQYFYEKTMGWIEGQRGVSNINELVIMVVGDLISGDIHHELTSTNEWPVPVQDVKAGMLISKLIAQFSAHFDAVRVEFITADNHSRRTHKPQYKQAGWNSEGYIVAKIAEERLKNLDNVEFKIHAKIKELIDIRGLRYLAQHGNTIRGWSGFPWYGLDKMVGKEAKERRMSPDRNFYKMVIGHFHTPLKTREYIVNGSLSGTTELDHGCGRHSPPCQVAFLVHPKWGDYNWNEFHLDEADTMDFGGDEWVE